MAEGDSQEDFHSLRSSLSEFSDSHDCWLSKQDFEDKIKEISEWVEEQKKGSKHKSVKENVDKVCKVATTTASAIQKFQSGNASDIVSGTGEIISSIAACAGPEGEVIGAIIGTLCSIIGAIFTANKPKQPSVVEKLAEVVHKELVDFNKKLQDQKYNGLKDRVSAQKVQLRIMKSGQELADPNLWNDYVQFMGELSYRFESPLPFKYDKNLTKDPDVADFVTAVATYCQAYNCLMSLLIAAKGRFTDLKEEKYREMADLVIITQREAAKAKLAFLSDKKYLTFLGRLPSEGGKLTKIVALSRNAEARSTVQMVILGLGLPSLPEVNTVEYKATIVSTQFVVQPEAPFSSFSSNFLNVQFMNKTKFPMRVVCATVGKCDKHFKFNEVVQPDSSIMKHSGPGSLSVGGYIILYLDGKVRSDDNPHEPDVTRVIEFAMSGQSFPQGGSGKINIQDKTGSEFTEGQDTYDKMKNRETKNIFWKSNDTHYMACAEIFSDKSHSLMFPGFLFMLWRFIVRDFDPFVDVASLLPFPVGNN